MFVRIGSLFLYIFGDLKKGIFPFFQKSLKCCCMKKAPVFLSLLSLLFFVSCGESSSSSEISSFNTDMTSKEALRYLKDSYVDGVVYPGGKIYSFNNTGTFLMEAVVNGEKTFPASLTSSSVSELDQEEKTLVSDSKAEGKYRYEEKAGSGTDSTEENFASEAKSEVSDRTYISAKANEKDAYAYIREDLNEYLSDYGITEEEARTVKIKKDASDALDSYIEEETLLNLVTDYSVKLEPYALTINIHSNSLLKSTVSAYDFSKTLNSLLQPSEYDDFLPYAFVNYKKELEGYTVTKALIDMSESDPLIDANLVFDSSLYLKSVDLSLDFSKTKLVGTIEDSQGQSTTYRVDFPAFIYQGSLVCSYDAEKTFRPFTSEEKENILQNGEDVTKYYDVFKADVRALIDQ